MQTVIAPNADVTVQYLRVNRGSPRAVATTVGDTVAGDEPQRSYRWDQSSVLAESVPDVLGSGSAGRWLVQDVTAGQSTGLVGLFTTALGLIVSEGDTRTTCGFSETGDGGGATFRGALGVSAGADGLTKINVANGQWQMTNTSSLDARALGVKGDIRRITDGVRNSGSALLTSASAAFTLADEGKHVLLVEPSGLVGTIDLVNGAIIAAGTGFSSIPREAWDGTTPISGGAVFCGLSLYVFRIIFSNTSVQFVKPPTVTAAAQPVYQTVQTKATIVQYINAMQVLLSVTASVSMTSVQADIGTMQTETLRDAIQCAFDVGAHELRMPPGGVFLDANLQFTSEQNLTIRGQSYSSSYIMDGRRCDEDYTHGIGLPVGLLDFAGCTNTVVEDLAWDLSVPKLGVLHATGRTENGNGCRSGIRFYNSPRSGFRRCGSRGYGARDEHTFFECTVLGTGDDGFVEDCNFELTNNNSINPNSSLLRRFRVTRCTARSAFSALNCAAQDSIVSDSFFYAQTEFPHFADIVTLDANGRPKMSSCIIGDGDTTLSAVSAVNVFGNGSVSDVQLTLADLTIRNVTSLWNDASGGAGITLDRVAGRSLISNCLMDGNTAFATGGRSIHIKGAATGHVEIISGYLGGRAGSNMTVGVEMDATVPVGAVRVGDGVRYSADSILQTIKGTDAQIQAARGVLVVTSTGTTVVPIGTRMALIMVNGAVTLQLGNAALQQGEPIDVVNGLAQLGTTSATSPTSSVTGTSALTGAGKAARYWPTTTWTNAGGVI